MDISSSSLQLQESNAFLFDCQSLLDQSNITSDAGYYSATLSPTSSIDSCSFSPPSYSPTHICPQNGIGTQVNRKSQPPKRTGRPRSKFPGVKRENASEREKLRMRDLTKALHHLRTYLPPSVAPVGKTLTKIETLRLAIEYISCLSEQLEVGGEESNHGVPAEQIQIAPSPLMFDNFSEASSATQSLQAQQFQPCYQNADEDFLTLQAQEFWMRQQHIFFHGQC